MYTAPRPPWKKPILVQLVLLVSASTLLLLSSDVLAVSFLVGGLVQLVPQAWFAQQAFKYWGTQQTPAIVRAMYRGEVGKVLLTATLIAIVLMTYKQWNYSAFFAAFMLMIPLQWVLNIRVLKR